jgi:hypothetical protein
MPSSVDGEIHWKNIRPKEHKAIPGGVKNETEAMLPRLI